MSLSTTIEEGKLEDFAIWKFRLSQAVPRRAGKDAVSKEWKVWPPVAPLSC